MKENRWTQQLLITILGGLLFLSISCSGIKHKDTKTPPNLLVILTDQWHGQALGFMNEDPVMTPHLDSLSHTSRVLKNFITNYPVCSPSRAIMMSGQYSFSNHVYANCNTTSAPYNVELAKETVTWSDILKDNGYSLGYIGKWHLDSPYPPYIPTYNNEGEKKWNEWTSPDRRHGFDYWYAYGTYDRHLKPMYWDTDAGRMDFHYVNEWGPKHEVDKAIEYLKNEKGDLRKNSNPFGLVVSMNPPHTEYKEVPEKYYNLYKDIPIDSFLKDPDIPPAGTPMGDAYRKDIKYYYAAVTGDDDQIGRLLRTLKELKLDDNTIVIFLSDHGNSLGKHEKITKNNLYEESIRVPFMIHWKGHIEAGLDTMNLMSMVDLYPTLMDLMGLDENVPSQTQGESYASRLLGEQKYDSDDQQFFMGNINPPDSSGGFRGVRTKQYKLIYERGKGRKLQKFFFNYEEDPFELDNQGNYSSQIEEKLDKELKDWLSAEDDPFMRNFD